MAQRPRKSRSDASSTSPELRIIGGSLRGRQFRYSGDITTRPMKDRVRESVFNLLGKEVAGTWAVDLFAGTGALGFEAISRGATGGTFVERHVPTWKLLGENARTLQIADQVRIVSGSAFVWSKRPDAPVDRPWTIFCAPPYDFFVDNLPSLSTMWAELKAAAPAKSLWVIESDARFEPSLLPEGLSWDIRPYPPAVVAIGRDTDR